MLGGILSTAQHSRHTTCASETETPACPASPLSLVLLFTDTRQRFYPPGKSSEVADEQQRSVTCER